MNNPSRDSSLLQKKKRRKYEWTKMCMYIYAIVTVHLNAEFFHQNGSFKRSIFFYM